MVMAAAVGRFHLRGRELWCQAKRRCEAKRGCMFIGRYVRRGKGGWPSHGRKGEGWECSWLSFHLVIYIETSARGKVTRGGLIMAGAGKGVGIDG
jgi:hypothetical protein